MTYTHLLIERRESVAYVTLNRPEVHNAFNEQLIMELRVCFEDIAVDPSVRAVVLAGAGPSFCAGADLTWMARTVEYTRSDNLADALELQKMFSAIAECPKATIARVHGPALGGGAGLAAVCDLAIATPDARFALSEVRLGLIPAVISPYVVHKVGMGAARALFVTGERINGEQPLRIGLVQQIAPLDELDGAVEAKLKLIREAGPAAIAAAKRLLRDIAGKTPAEAAEVTVQAIADLRVTPEAQEGIRAFLEKRKPEFAE